MSVFLYLSRPAYQIPRSVSEFYRIMISHLIRRHDFALSGGRKNRFDAEDKERYLREFALAMASREGRFEDFTFGELRDFAEQLIKRLARVPDDAAKDFVNEVINNSGLIVQVSEAGEYAFNHRSVQEHLVAEQLARDPAAGAGFLLDRAHDSDWRQVVLFFAAFDHDHVESFVRRLGAQHPELAGNCLAAAMVTDEVAVPILDRLLALVGEKVTADRISAMVAATRSARESIRAYAVDRVSEALTSPQVVTNLNTLIADDPEGVMRLVHALAATNAPHVAAQVVSLSALLPDNEYRVVGPLWTALAVPGMIDVMPRTTGHIVGRLLRLAMDPRGFAELQQAVPHRPDVVNNPALIELAYPFHEAQGRGSNLVTLLALAEHLGVTPDPPNAYFKAKAAGGLAGLERARRVLAISPYRPVRIAFFACYAVVLAVAVAVAMSDWRMLIRPFGWWTLGVVVAPGLLAVFVAICLSSSVYSRGRRLYLVDRANKPLRQAVDAALEPALVVEDDLDLRWPDGDETPAFSYTMERHRKETSWDGLLLSSDQGAPVLRRYRVPNNVLHFGPAGVAKYGHVYWDPDTASQIVLGGVYGLPYAVALAPLLGVSVALYVLVATVTIWVLFWLPATRLCNVERRIYLRKPSPFLYVYEDPQSRPWVTP
ncbi:NACHT domain-containing protein [Luedemannella flava]